VTHVVTTSEEKKNHESFKLKAVRQSSAELLTEDEAEALVESLVDEGFQQNYSYEESNGSLSSSNGSDTKLDSSTGIDCQSRDRIAQTHTTFIESTHYSNGVEGSIVSLVNSPTMKLADNLKVNYIEPNFVNSE